MHTLPMQVTDQKFLKVRPSAMSPVFAKPMSELVIVSLCFIKNHVNHQKKSHEAHLVIQFFKVKNIHPAKIHHQLVDMYGEGVMNKENVPKWCWFNGRREDVHNAAQSGRPSVITEDLKES
jgi:hypothetical protein